MPYKRVAKNTAKTSAKDSRKSVFLNGEAYRFVQGDCFTVLVDLPDESVNCVITSPPYWKQRDYDVSKKYAKMMIGNEATPEAYVSKLGDVFDEVRRILCNDGSLWLNIGDKYVNKDLAALPWMMAIELKKRGWILRNDVVWNKMKGTQSVKDRLRTTHEYLFHFVKSKSYYYDYKSLLVQPRSKPKKKNGKVLSATGVSGVKYKKSIRESKDLSAVEKRNAMRELNETIVELETGKINDFRMSIRGVQRIYHGNKQSESGRAKELKRKGYYILKMSSAGFIPNTVWNIVPEDVWRRDDHCAVFPVELLETPIKATCPPGGTVMDPFMGTGSAVLAAMDLGRRGIGIEQSSKYIQTAKDRLGQIVQDA